MNGIPPIFNWKQFDIFGNMKSRCGRRARRGVTGGSYRLEVTVLVFMLCISPQFLFGQADPQLLPDTLDFGPITVDQQGTATLRVLNQGDEAYVVDDIAFVGIDHELFELIGSVNLPDTIDANGDSLVIDVGFTPDTPGDKSAFIVLTSPDNSPIDAPLVGSGVLPDIAVASKAVFFDSTLVLDTLQSVITVSNIGIGALIISDIQIIGADASDFLLDSTISLPLVINPEDGEVEIGVAFSPQSVDDKLGYVVLTNNDPDDGVTFIALEGVGVEPELRSDPVTLDFGEVRVATDSILVISIYNDASGPYAADLEVFDLVISGDSASLFELVDAPDLPEVIQPGGLPLVFSMRATPSATGLSSAELQISTNEYQHSPNSVELLVTGVVPDVYTATSTVNFGDVWVNADSLIQLDIENVGGASLTISDLIIGGTDVSSFTLVDAPVMPVSIGAYGGTLPLSIQFSPDALLEYSAQLQVISDDPDENPLELALVGTGVLPAILASADSLDFGNVRVETSSIQEMTVENTGTAPLEITAVSIAGPDENMFLFDSLPPVPFTLEVGSDPGLISVAFTPHSIGEKNADLVFMSDDPEQAALTVPLKGIGAEPVIGTDSETMAFGPVLVGIDSTLGLVYDNSGGVPLRIDSFHIAGPDSLFFSLQDIPVLPITLPFESSIGLNIRYFPLTLGEHRAELLAYSDDPNQPVFSTPLAGEGVLPEIFVSESTLDFGPVKLDGDSAMSLTIENTGGAPLTISSFILLGEHAPLFTLSGFPDLPATIEPGEAGLTGNITFESETTGRKIASLRIVNNDPSSIVATVLLRARAVPAPELVEIPILTNVVAGEDLQVSTRVTADTSIRSVVVRYGVSAETGFTTADTLNASPEDSTLYSTIIDGDQLGENGLKMMVVVTDNYPTITADTFYASVQLPRGSLQHQFDTALLNRWQMFSLPFSVTDNQEATIEDILGDLGDEGDFSWRIFRTDASGLSENYYGSSQLVDLGRYGEFAPGNAFWIYLRDDDHGSVASTLLGFPQIATVPADSFVYELQPGWNQVGSPYNFELSWGQVRSDQKDSLRVYRWNGVAWNETLNKTGWSPMVNVDFALPPWEGFYIHNLTESTVRLRFTPGMHDSSSVQYPRLSELSEWQIAAVAESRTNFDVAVLGMHSLARDDRDAFDFPGASGAGEQFVQIRFPNNLVSDLRAHKSEGDAWFFDVLSNEPVTELHFQDTHTMPSAFKLMLIDRKYGDRYDIVDAEKIALRNLSSADKERFVIAIGTESYVAETTEAVELLLPERYALLSNYPNPFNPTTNIRFNLPEAGIVRLEIFNILGERVATLLEGNTEAGYHEIQWNGRNQFGVETGSGFYFYRLSINDFTQTKKMLKLK